MNKIIVSLQGGLGNQLFQYASAKALADQNNSELSFDLEWFKTSKTKYTVTNREFALAPFEITAAIEPIKELPKNRISRKLYNIFFRKEAYNIYYEKSFNFDENFFKINTPVHLKGYWQSYKYFQNIENTIRLDLGTPKNLSNASLTMMQKIQGSDAICLHIRRGDYVSNKHANDFHGLCELEYYNEALSIVSKDLALPHCFIFSDEPGWVRENMLLPFTTTIVDINGPDTPHEDLWLMAACRRFVIANSSLSWWGAWLSNHSDKIVVAPKKWFRNDSQDTSDLIPDNWIRM